MPKGARILEDGGEDLVGLHVHRCADDAIDAKRCRPGLHDSNVLRMAVLVDEERASLRLGNTLRHCHCFGRSGGFVEKRGIGDVQARQVTDHGLVVEKRLEPTLGDFRLVGRVGRVPCRILEDVPLNRGRRHRAVVALPDQRRELVVALGDIAHPLEQFPLGKRRLERERLFLPDRFRNGLVDQLVKRGNANCRQHGLHLSRGRADMAPIGKIVGLIFGWLEGHPDLRKGKAHSLPGPAGPQP